VATVDTISTSESVAAPAGRFDIDFAPGSPDLGSFPRTHGCVHCDRASPRSSRMPFGYVAPQGLHAARVAVADYLRRTRGVLADPHHIVLCSGATQAIALLSTVLSDHTVAMEDPGFWLHRMVLRHNGIEPVAVPVDDDGLDVDALALSGATAVLATPAHQSPTGVVLSATRRTALVQWARADHLVIEDDYDAEYRYDRAPVGALQGIAPDRWCTSAPRADAGTRAADRVDGVARASRRPGNTVKRSADTGSSVMDQIAFSKLLTSGAYDRHLRQMRRRYVARRNVLLRGLARYLPEATVLGAAAGVHLTVVFPAGFDIPVSWIARRRCASGSSRWRRATPKLGWRHRFDVGYANITESQIVEGVKGLAQARGAAAR